jgi:dethiobiotin synthetase
MQKGIFITGTDTDIGKTWLGQRLIQALVKKGVDVVPRKPIESGWLKQIAQTDAGKLARSANKTTDRELQQNCLYRFKPAISPLRAARLAKQNITLEKLRSHCFAHLHPQQFLHVEGAGGFYSPIAENGLNADLAEYLALPIIVVAEDRLGCINQILLTIEAAQRRNLNILAIFLNKKAKNTLSIQAINPQIEMDNQSDLAEYTAIPIIDKLSQLVEIVYNENYQ